MFLKPSYSLKIIITFLNITRKLIRNGKIFFLPLDYAKLVQGIKADKSLSPTEKAEKITRVYEDYLYSLAKPAFDEYDKIRARFGANSSEVIAAEKKLAGILQKLAIDINAVTRNLGDNAIDVFGKNTLNYK